MQLPTYLLFNPNTPNPQFEFIAIRATIIKLKINSYHPYQKINCITHYYKINLEDKTIILLKIKSDLRLYPVFTFT